MTRRGERRVATLRREKYASPGGHRACRNVFVFKDGTRLRRNGNAWLVAENGERWAIGE